jgi:hypothetical protein
MNTLSMAFLISPNEGRKLLKSTSVPVSGSAGTQLTYSIKGKDKAIPVTGREGP